MAFLQSAEKLYQGSCNQGAQTTSCCPRCGSEQGSFPGAGAAPEQTPAQLAFPNFSTFKPPRQWANSLCLELNNAATSMLPERAHRPIQSPRLSASLSNTCFQIGIQRAFCLISLWFSFVKLNSVAYSRPRLQSCLLFSSRMEHADVCRVQIS